MQISRNNKYHLKDTGFGLIELIMVMVLLGIVSVLAAPTLGDVGQIRAQYAAYKIQSDIRYAQLVAMETQQRTRVRFDALQDRYFLELEDNGGNWVPIPHPATREDFEVQLNSGQFSNVSLSSILLNGGSEVRFDAYGTPYNSSDTKLTSPAYVELNQRFRIELTEQTGATRIQVV